MTAPVAEAAAAVDLAAEAEALQVILADQDAVIAADVGGLFNSYASHPNFYPLLQQAMPVILGQHAQAAGLVTSQWYNEIDPRSDYRAKPFGVDIPAEQIDKTIHWSLYAPGEEPPVDRLTTASQRIVRGASRDTVTENAKAEGVHWARYASRTACSFCRILATRGAVYHTAAAAGLEHKYHNHCHCVATPQRAGQVLVNPHADEWEQQYIEAKRQVRRDNKPATMENIAAEMRRMEAPPAPAPKRELVSAPGSTALEKPRAAKGVAPKGMDREKWITEVQPGPIPDYDNSYAVSAQLRARHPNLDANLGSMIDSSLAQSTAQAIDDLTTKYPDVQLRSVKALGSYKFQNSSRYAQTDVFTQGNLAETEIQFNQDFYMKRKTLEDSYAKTVAAHYHPTTGDHDAAYSIATHEFAHSMDASGSYRASASVKDVLRDEFLRTHPEYQGVTSIVEQIRVREAYDQWLTDQLSDYATGVGRRMRMRLPGDINPSEALAESFTHVELDPEHATDAERALHKLLVDQHTLPYKPDMKVPEWQMNTGEKPVKGDRYLRKYQRQIDKFYQEHATPEQLAAAKEARLAASKAEQARKKAANAVARSQSDDIPKAEIVKAREERAKGLKSKGDPSSEAERVRASMDPERIKANRTALWSEVSPKVRAEGKVWYPSESQTLLDIHSHAGSPLAGDPLEDLKVEGIGAAFSPQVDWKDAKTDVLNYFRTMDRPYQEKVDAIVAGRGGRHLTENVKRADRVRVATTPEEIDLALRGTQASTSHYFDNGPKVRNFYGNLTGHHDLLTSDTWDGKVARLSPDERRFLINNEIREKNYRSAHPVPLEDLDLLQKGDWMSPYLVDHADALADAANEVARAAGRPEPYLPSPGLMVTHGYDILEATAAATVPEGYAVDQYQAGLWIWLRGGGATGLKGVA